MSATTIRPLVVRNIGLCVACFMSQLAYAQSNVTIYGGADISFVSVASALTIPIGRDYPVSLSNVGSANSMAMGTVATIIQGAHSRPLSHRVATGKKAFWVAGDWGTDDHSSRDGNFGLAELGVGYNYGPAQLNVAIGQSWARQDFTLDGHSKTDGTYLLAEGLIPVSGNLWATISGYGYWGDSDLKRGYMNAGLPDRSKGTPDLNTWGVRARLDWENALSVAGADFTPYADLSYTEAKMDGYTETGGGLPARFDSRKDKATELRLGLNLSHPIGNANLFGTAEAVHRFESSGAHTTGELIGLIRFDLDGQDYKRDWLRVGLGIEGKLADGVASLSINATTRGEAPDAWLAASYRMSF